MDRKITSENLYLLLPGKASSFARIYLNKRGGSVLDALRAYYHSDTYKKLEKEETKYWHYGPVALYEDFEESERLL